MNRRARVWFPNFDNFDGPIETSSNFFKELYMLRRIAGVMIALVCVCMTFGQSAQFPTQSNSKSQSTFSQGQKSFQQFNNQTKSYQNAAQPTPAQGGQYFNNTNRAQQNFNSASYGQTNKQAYNPVNSPVLQPIATTTPNTAANASSNQGQNAQQFSGQQWQPQQYYYYNNSNWNNGWNRQQFRPVRRVWNFTRTMIPFSR